MIHNISRFIAALALLATAQGAWADTETVSYIDADGNAQTVTATVLTGNEEPSQWGPIELAAGWYVVKGNISYTNQISYGSSIGTIHIILADGAQMSVDKNGNDAIFLNDYFPLAIYGQSAGTGRLSVTSDHDAIFSTGVITINGGIVSATSTGNGCPAIDAYNGAITINGGQVTATPGDNAKGIRTKGTITLGLRSTSDFITANGYSGTVNIKDGQALKDPSGNIYYGTLTDAQKSAIANVTLQPATQAEFIAAALPQTAADTYTISDAAGWDAFCLALQDNDTWNRFSGKTVALDADITVTRMAGGENHEFTGTFYGDGHTLTVSISSSDGNAAPFREIMGATIRNLKVSGTVSGHKHSAGLVSYARGADSSVENTIENCLVATDVSTIVDTDGDCYLGGIVGHGFNCKLTIRGCAFTGSLISPHNYTGGLQGWSDGNTLILEDDIFAASSVNAANVGFHPIAFHVNNATTTATVTNVYYTVAPTCTTASRIAAAGKQAHTVTAGDNVTLALSGTATEYGVSGITVYESNHGIKFGTTYYAGSGDQLSLTLSNSATGAPRGYQYGYTASAGTLSGTTLTMPDQDVTISVNTAALAPIDWATVNQGNSADPYMIYNKDQLLLLAHRVNGTNGETANDYYGMYFKLGADITFDPNDLTLDEGQSNYEAIGGNIGGLRYFNGKFDGDGHTISGIRIRKDGSSTADYYQGLFGCTGGGAYYIHDVHLTDARITGYVYVGGIIGLSTGTGSVSGCTVTDSYITATHNRNYGTICGTNNGGTLTNNYYHGCTVNDTPVTSGMGCSKADITADNGALPAYRLDLGANITTPPGTFADQTVWLDTPPVGARLAPENGFTLAGNHYFASGYVFTPGSTLASGAAQGYTPRATLGGQLLDLYTPTGDPDPLAGKAIARLTITADCDGKTLASTEAIYSTGQPVTVAYIKADGTPGEASAIALDGHEAVDEYGDVCLAPGTYYVGTDIAYANPIRLDGAVTLILADGKTMTLNGNTYGIFTVGNDLTIYGQSLDDDAGTLRYNGTEAGISASNYEQHSGNVSITTGSSEPVSGIYASNVTLLGGTLTVTADGDIVRAISGGMLSILGGQLDATATGDNATGIDSGIALTLGWTRPADRITASSISTGEGGTVAVADGQALTDGSGNIYTGTLSASVLSGFAAETTLQPCLALADAADNTAAITDHAGQTLAVALSGRTLYKDGSWNTLCLPFAVADFTGTPLEGATVKTLTSSSFAGGTLTMNFSDDNLTSIQAGKPYIVKWAKPDGYEGHESDYDISEPVFMGVTIPAAYTGSEAIAAALATAAVPTASVDFKGTFSPVSIAAGGDNTKLYLGAANTLYYPNDAMTIGCQRAYFQLAKGITAGNSAGGNEHGDDVEDLVRAFNLNFGDESTGITEAEANSSLFTLHSSLQDWYTLDGRRLDGQPTQRGIYINNGKKVVIK